MEVKSGTGLEQVLGDVKSGTIFPVYLIYGDDNYQIRETTRKIIEAILPERDRDTNLEMVEGGYEDWNKIIQSLNTFPLFGSRRIVAVQSTTVFHSKVRVEELMEESFNQFKYDEINDATRFFRMGLGFLDFNELSEMDDRIRELQVFVDKTDLESRSWLEKMVEECKAQNLPPMTYRDDSDELNDTLRKHQRDNGASPTNILILSTTLLDRRKKLYKTIGDIGVIIDLSIQKAKRDPNEVVEDERRTLLQQATELLKRGDKVFGKGAFEVLAKKTGYNIGIFTNELEKVILSLKENRKIEINNIEEIVGKTKEDSIFDLQNALARKDLEKAFLSFKDLLGQGEPAVKILYGIANGVRQLILAKEFIEKDLKGKWNKQMDVGAYKKFIYFPIILKKKREGQEKHRSNIYKLPSDVLLELF